MGLRVRDGAGDTRGCGDSGWEAGCPLPENTVVSPLLCGVGFRLLPAFISARSSELSPVGDIMLKDLVLGIWPPPRGPWEFMVALGPALGTPADVCPPSTAQLQSTDPASHPTFVPGFLAQPHKGGVSLGPSPFISKASDPWTEPAGASKAIRLRTLVCHPAGPSLGPHPQTDSRHTDCKRSTHLWQSNCVALGDLGRRSLLRTWERAREDQSPKVCKYLDRVCIFQQGWQR